ncbi:MAG TPA: hypothetical protein PLQ57_16525 [Saprospiraceae bacterium]|nr:hypothetical protein [Saprospiraceae bacterium]HRG22648.1 hypothetical protein [Saprospiraceae bacterium]
MPKPLSYVPGWSVAGCSVAGCSVAGCSVAGSLHQLRSYRDWCSVACPYAS